MLEYRSFFPFFSQSTEIYLDSAATSQRLNASLESMQEYFVNYNANVHRGGYVSAQKATNKYEFSRGVIAEFLGGDNADEVVFTSGATEAINIVALGLTKDMYSGTCILVLESEHHANLLPWQSFAKRNNMAMQRIKLGKNGQFDSQQLAAALTAINDNIAIVAMAHVSNVLGNIYPVKEICERASLHNAITVIDGTQASAHIKIDVKDIACDFYAISGHKMYASTGIGALYGKYSRLVQLIPTKLGGEMIKSVSWDSYNIQPPPLKFEAGTPNIAGALSMAAAARFIQQNMLAMQAHEKALYQYLLSKLAVFESNENIHILGNKTRSAAIIAFYADAISSNDIATFLATKNIAVRAGHHCAMPLMQSLNIGGCIRVSLACYTTLQDIDGFINALTEVFALNPPAVNGQELSKPIDSDRNKKHKQPAPKLNDNQTIAAKLSSATDWNSKHRLLLLFSKQLPVLPPEQRNADNFVQGCETNVWLARRDRDNTDDTAQFLAYADSKVVRGLLVVILDKLNNSSGNCTSANDINEYLKLIGLSPFFSAGRRDGIQQIIKRISALQS